MKASELRIGNFYNDNGINCVVTPSTIESVFKNERIWCKPIPLTEEWLLKFRAKELIPKSGILKEFVLKTVRIEMSNSGNFYYKNSKLILESVHQLQNLYFALTGEELTFKSE